MRIPQMSLSNEPCPDNIFIDYGNGGTEYSANDIYEYAKELAYSFKTTLKIEERSFVVLVFESGITNLITFLGCIMANLIPVVLCPDDILKIKAIVSECSPRYAFISPRIGDLLSNKIENLFTLPDLEERFSTCISLIDDYKGIIKIDIGDTLKLYSYYKQAIQGNSSTQRPSFYEMKQTMKWDAWNKLRDTSSQEAKIQYCATARRLLDKHALLQSVLTVPHHVIDISTINSDISRSVDRYAVDPHDVCFVQYSSGSTSNPKGIKISYSNIEHNMDEIKKICRDKGYFDNPSSISWLPHYHDMGLIGGYLSKYYCSLSFSGQRIYCMSPQYFLQNTQDIYVDLFTKISCIEMPNFSMSYLQNNVVVDDNLDLSNIKLVWCGSEKINRQVQEKFVEKFERNNFESSAIINSYGLAEQTLIVSYGSYADKVVNGTVSVGKMVDSTSCVIVNEENGRFCSENITGIIYLSGPSSSCGYLNKSLNKEAFININDVPYYRTGDLGFSSNGLLYVQGRDSEKIIINGKNIYPDDIEQSLSKLQNVSLQNVVSFGINDGVTERVVVVIECRSDMKPDFNIIQVHLLRVFGFSVYNIVLVPPGSIARTSSSKKKRANIMQMYRDDQFTVIDQYRNISRRVDNTHLCHEIIEDFGIFAEVDYETCKHHTLVELGMTSMTYSMYAQKIESRNRRDVCFNMSVCNDTTLQQFYELLLFVYDKTNKVDPMFLKEKDVYLSEELKEIMIRDSQIIEDELPKYTSVSKGMAHNPDTILLTGATGYLGIYLLYELIASTNAIIVCIIRSTGSDHATERVRDKLKEQKLTIPDDILLRRCRFLKGDIADSLLGLGEENYNILSKTIDVVLHSAAEINYVSSYNNLKESNVNGTKNIIKFCFRDQRKELHLVGSTLIFGWTYDKRLFETNNNSGCNDIAIGYGQCKWVVEQLVYNARKYGLVSKNYRPTFVTASGVTKEYTSSDIVSILFEYTIKKRIAIRENLLWDAISVDCCSKNIVSLSKIDDFYDKTFHLTQSEGQPIIDFYEVIKTKLGIKMKEMGFLEFVDHIANTATPDDAIYPLIPFIKDNKNGIMRMENKIYDNSWTKECFKKYNLHYHVYTIEENISAIVDFLSNKCLI